MTTMVAYIKSLAMHVLQLDDWKSRFDYKEQVASELKDLPVYVGTALAPSCSSDILVHVYYLSGQLVKHCSSLIYTKVQYSVINNCINNDTVRQQE